MNTYTIYEPAEDSYLIKKQIRFFAKKNTLEIGTGSGILAVEASKYAKSVLAVDIQKEVINYCKNKHKNNKKITWKHSNLFSNIKIHKHFDCIIMNPPYLPDDERVQDIVLDGGKKGYELTERFLNEANNYLNKEGTILLLFSSLTKKEKVDEIIEINCFTFKQVDEQKLAYEVLYVYAITKSKILKQLEHNKITQVKKFSKGKRGIIYKAVYKKKPVIIKVKNPKSTAMSTIKFEADWLKKLNKEGIGPKLLKATETFFVMEYLEGILFKEYIETNTKEKIKLIIKKLMQQLFLLDTLGINKQEMKNPYKHIIIKNHKPIMIDFERCRYTENPRNITQFCQYITSKNIEPILESNGININKEQVQNAAKRYKNEMTKEKYNKLLKIILTDNQESNESSATIHIQ
jgi:HemK-related putative methylase